MNYYIADMHFGHEKKLRVCHRPFGTVSEMNKTIISNWNRRIGKDDHVYIVGDVGHTSCDIVGILNRLHGQKHLITGNHDRYPLQRKTFRKCFVEIRSILEVRDGDMQIVLSHYPMAEWNGFYAGSWHFYGHIHNSEGLAASLMKKVPRAVNVGADCIGFTPRTAKELKEMAKK